MKPKLTDKNLPSKRKGQAVLRSSDVLGDMVKMDIATRKLLDMSLPEKKCDALLLRLSQSRVLAAHYSRESEAALSRYKKLRRIECSLASKSHKLLLAALRLVARPSLENSERITLCSYICRDVIGDLRAMSPNGQKLSHGHENRS